MANDKEEDDQDFAVDSDYPEPDENGGPPDDWSRPSFYDRKAKQWYWQGKVDPCPVKPLGFRDGDFFFVSGAGERRSWRSSQLHGRGGLADLFCGELWWPLKHFRKFDPEVGAPTGGLQEKQCVAMFMRLCKAEGVYDINQPYRSIGTWRAADGSPVVHAGRRVFADDGTIHAAGCVIDDMLYTIGVDREAPAYVNVGRRGYEWAPAPLADCLLVGAHLDEWHWQDVEARDLFLGGLWCDMLGDAPLWKPHKFVRAPAGAGKTNLLKYARALLGGSAHGISRSYSKAALEDLFSRTSCAILLDEMESDTEVERLRKINELVLLLSDDGATGGRFKRAIDLHGLITMVATVRDDWKATLKSRVVCLELRPLKERLSHPPVPPETLLAMINRAAELSPGIRARVLACWPLFKKNLALTRARILELGGSPRDADQLGHVLAGWACMTSDQPLSEDDVGRLDRFEDYIVSVVDAQDGADDAGDLLNVLFGLPAQSWRGGDQLTIGQLVARARQPDNTDMRRTLLGYGMRLERVQNEGFPQAWLAIANNHPGLDRLLGEYPQYKGGRRGQILASLSRGLVRAQPSERPLRFAGVQSRAHLIPPDLLPDLAEEKAAIGDVPPPASGRRGEDEL